MGNLGGLKLSHSEEDGTIGEHKSDEESLVCLVLIWNLFGFDFAMFKLHLCMRQRSACDVLRD